MTSERGISDEELLKALSEKVEKSNVEDVVEGIINRHNKARNLDTDDLETELESNQNEIKSQLDYINHTNKTLNKIDKGKH